MRSARSQSWGSAATDKATARRARETKILAIQEKGAYTSASLVVGIVPWGTLAAAGAYATGLAFKAAIAIRKGEDKALAGDTKVIAGFIKHSAKWSGEKRKRIALKLNKQLEGLKKRGKKKKFLSKKTLAETDTNRIKTAKTQMKIAALVALEAESRKDKTTPLVAGDTATTPVSVEANPASSAPDAAETAFTAAPTGWYVAGGAVLVASVAIALSRRTTQ